MTNEPDARDRWESYYARTRGRPPRDTLLFAADRFAAPGFAVDLGAGGGRDTIELLRRGWRVLAADEAAASAEALARLAAETDLPAGAALETLTARFEEAAWPACDLVNASFALPLLPKARFPDLWRRIVGSLRPGGRFAGQLFGLKDSWAGDPGITHLSRGEVDGLLAGLDVELFREEESDATTPRGRPKHWHLYHVVAAKP